MRIVWAIIAGLIVLAGGWWMLRDAAPPTPAPTVAPPPPREAFHASKPLRIVVVAAGEPASNNSEWLERELRYLLDRGKMRIAALPADDAKVFTLRVEVRAEQQALIQLVAPDGVMERELQIEIATEDQLTTVRGLAQRLPEFLTAHASSDWAEFVGTDDVKAYETYLRNSVDLLGAAGSGVTQPQTTPQQIQIVERLEALSKLRPRFARAWSALAIAYLGLGGEDESALAQLAESSAERALALDAELADAHSALGLVQSRAGAWAMAKEHFDAALAIDPNAAAALEGLSCLLADVGQSRAALQVGLRAIALQPKNTGARECVAYAQLSVAGAEEPAPQETSAGTPRVRVLAALLSDDVTTARTLLRNSTNGDATQWTDPLLRAAADRSHIAAALQAITRAANDGHIDATTEILGGVALKQSDFVFNRMLRLHRKKEPVPLRLLWLQQTGFLRTHARFEQLISASSLASFWQDHSPPDVCSSEPSVYGCKLSAKGK